MECSVEGVKARGWADFEDRNLNRLSSNGAKGIAELAGLVSCAGYKHAPSGERH
jgi:hypothetical protein